MPPKKKASSQKEMGEASSEMKTQHSSVEEEPPKKRRKPTLSKEKASKEPQIAEDGWILHPPSLIYRDLENSTSSKIAAFDFDGTLAVQKSRLQFPRDADDWVLYNQKVPEILKDLQSKDFKLVIFSNQGGIKSALQGAMALKVTKRIGLDIPVLMATNKDDNRKPATGMWDFFIKHGNGGKDIDKQESFFVGDAAGNENDFSDSDKILPCRQFAANVGIGFKTPKELFGDPSRNSNSKGVNQELANAFRQYAQVQEAEGGNQFAIRATYKAADIIEEQQSKIAAGKEMAGIKGIGKGTIAKIDEFLATGSIGEVKNGNNDPVKAEQADMAAKFL